MPGQQVRGDGPATYDPMLLVAHLGLGLRATARRCNLDPAMFYRRWSAWQADRHATRLGIHPCEVWPTWLSDGLDVGNEEFA